MLLSITATRSETITKRGSLMKTINNDITAGLVLFFSSLMLYTVTNNMPTGPAIFPKIILATLAGLAFIVFSSGLQKTIKAVKNHTENTRVFENSLSPFVTYLSICLYVGLIGVLGFFSASSIAAIFFMLYFGANSYLHVFLVTLCINSFIYLLFVWQLRISLPTGILF